MEIKPSRKVGENPDGASGKAQVSESSSNRVGINFIIGIYMMMQVGSTGWSWMPHQLEYEKMIVGIYASLGVFLIRPAKNSLANASLIWFTIMLVQATVDES